MKKILMIGTYPIKNPQHGGQKRTHAIYECYKEQFKDVIYSAVFFKGFYKEHGKNDIPLSRHSTQEIHTSPFTGDIVCGEAIFKDPVVKRKLTRLLKSYKPEIIHIEQPFPYLGLKPLLKELGMKPKIIFGSQNIEAPMKREILEGLKLPEKNIKGAEALIHNLEVELSQKCDLLAACTEADLSVHKNMGAKNTVLAPNGIAKSHASKLALERRRKFYDENEIQRTVLFVASAHPPSWTGFLTMVGKGMGFLPIDSKLVMAGSICDFFQNNVTDDSLEIEDVTFWHRTIAAGRVSEDDLVALLETSDVIILPITEGGGSNLKTAEAILADKKVVATSHALRSYEWFADFPNLWVTDDPVEFRTAITEALNSKLVTRNSEQKELAKKVQWTYRLHELVEKATQL